jgi:environmental stress-induced protein Ves
VGANDFSWRFAKARIDNSVPFSIYPSMDRIFMMPDGGGMDLEFENGSVLQVHEKWVPHQFSCDIPLFCKLRSGPSLDLNFLIDRKKHSLACEIIRPNAAINTLPHTSQTFIYVLQGQLHISSETLEKGDTVILESHPPDPTESTLFVTHISPVT